MRSSPTLVRCVDAALWGGGFKTGCRPGLRRRQARLVLATNWSNHEFPVSDAVFSNMDWDEHYKTGEVFWDKGTAAPALAQYLKHHPMSGKTLVPGCGRGREVAMAVENGLDAIGLD